VAGMHIDIALLRKRAELLQLVRRFFIRNGYLEVETPILAPFLIPEPAIEVFKTRFRSRFRETVDCFLIPSPELWMKRILAHGSGSIFQVTKAFRNCETAGKLHNPEFTLLEWYSVGHDYLQEMEVVERLTGFLIETMDLGRARHLKAFLPPFGRTSMRDLFLSHTGVDLDAVPDAHSLGKSAVELGLEVRESESWEELFNRIFLTLVEPRIGDKPLLLYDYPAGIPTLARTDGRYAERWELYMRGVEIANCYTEETSPERLKRFFENEGERKKGCLQQHPVDRGLIEEFAACGQECSGVALGLDRLFMLLLDLESVERVLPFSFSKFFI
jgi:lysyl-tRNA synthetase class 2